MDQALAIYLPMDRRHALATGIPLPARTQGAVLFADIAGFTPLTETLTRELGPRRGAEELPRQLNLIYDALIREVDRYGGSVIDFAGDAITCWFDQDTGRRATACGLAMQEAMRAFATVELPSGSTAAMAMKVAAASGVVQRLLVGDPQVQLMDVLAGATLTRMAAAEQVAQKGEVVLDEVTADRLGALLDIPRWRSDEQGARFAVVAGLRESVAPHPWPPLASGSLHPEALRPWLLPTVYERLQAGQGEFLTELRPAVALFLRFGGIDYDADPEAGQKLDGFVRQVQALLIPYEGTLLQLTIAEKGSYLYAAFGAPIAHEDDARRAALTALQLRSLCEGLPFMTHVQMGLTRGTMRTGAYGGSTRRTYGSLGDEVNLAARLMQHARPGQIIASGRVQRATPSLFTWQPLEEIRVKGKREPIPIFALVGTDRSTTIHLQEPRYTLPLVGRKAELAMVEEKIAQVLAGHGQLVNITAEAGMGKSRLVAEVIRHATRAGLQGYGGECQSFGINTPYLVWQSIWRAFFALDENSSLKIQQKMVERQLARLNPALLPRLPLIGSVLNLPLPDTPFTRTLSAAQRKQFREALLVDVLKARAATSPLLLVLEDAHWLDPLSQDLLDNIARAIRQARVLLVLACRPPEALARPAPQALSLPYASEIPLASLTPQEAVQLMDGKLAEWQATHDKPLPGPVVEQ
nr:AAA family ATPase [Ardenticatenales bacterium]